MAKRWIKSETMHLTLEVVLILSSVLIFRSSWLLIDMVPGSESVPALLTMLVVGIVATLLMVNVLFKHEKHY